MQNLKVEIKDDVWIEVTSKALCAYDYDEWNTLVELIGGHTKQSTLWGVYSGNDEEP